MWGLVCGGGCRHRVRDSVVLRCWHIMEDLGIMWSIMASHVGDSGRLCGACRHIVGDSIML